MVHNYDDVNWEIVYAICTNHLSSTHWSSDLVYAESNPERHLFCQCALLNGSD